MADFTFAISSGATRRPWIDVASPPRINPLPGLQPHYESVDAGVGPLLRLSATLNDGTFEPTDAALLGRLFIWSYVERAGNFVPITSPVGGKTSVATIDSSQLDLGHHLVLAWRPLGGAVAIPFIVE